ncbi:MAG: four helix bundle protein [Planctomycetota bacterium]
MPNFRKLRVWHSAKRLAHVAFDLRDELPAVDRYDLGRQMCRSAVSIAANIAEGARRGSDAEFARFLRIAHGARAEHETDLELGFERGWWSKSSYQRAQAQSDSTRKQLLALIIRLRPPAPGS